jgi:hypothetical protein
METACIETEFLIIMIVTVILVLAIVVEARFSISGIGSRSIFYVIVLNSSRRGVERDTALPATGSWSHWLVFLWLWIWIKPIYQI